MPKYKDYKEYSSGHNEKYMGGKMGYKVMGHDKKPMGIKTDSQKFDMGRLDLLSMEYKGYPDKAFDYKY